MSSLENKEPILDIARRVWRVCGRPKIRPREAVLLEYLSEVEFELVTLKRGVIDVAKIIKSKKQRENMMLLLDMKEDDCEQV
jgi:hypothetical protein